MIRKLKRFCRLAPIYIRHHAEVSMSIPILGTFLAGVYGLFLMALGIGTLAAGVLAIIYVGVSYANVFIGEGKVFHWITVIIFSIGFISLFGRAVKRDLL